MKHCEIFVLLALEESHEERKSLPPDSDKKADSAVAPEHAALGVAEPVERDLVVVVDQAGT